MVNPSYQESLATATSAKFSQRPKALLSAALIALALGYVAYMISQHMAQMQEARQRLSIIGIAGFSILATVSISLTTAYHAIFLLRLKPTAAAFFDIGMAYAMGQIVRYLPGKVAGVVFEANYLRGQFELSTIALTTLAQTATNYLWAGLFSATILACTWLTSPLPLLALAPALALVWAIHHFAWSERIISALPWAGKYLSQQASSQWNTSASVRLTVLLALNWLPILLGFVVLLHDQMSAADAVAFAAAYISAAVISSAIILVPSGIIVREALFVWIGSQVSLPASELILLSGLLRVTMTFSDLLNVAVFWLASTGHDRKRRLQP